VTLRFAYLAVLRMLGWMALLTRSDLTKDTEILVLRQQIAALQRHVNTPRPPGERIPCRNVQVSVCSGGTDSAA
jgi:hypothetical protein